MLKIPSGRTQGTGWDGPRGQASVPTAPISSPTWEPQYAGRLQLECSSPSPPSLLTAELTITAGGGEAPVTHHLLTVVRVLELCCHGPLAWAVASNGSPQPAAAQGHGQLTRGSPPQTPSATASRRQATGASPPPLQQFAPPPPLGEGEEWGSALQLPSPCKLGPPCWAGGEGWRALTPTF